MSMARGFWLSLMVVFFILDQLTKQLISSLLTIGGKIPVVYGLNLTLEHNTGIAFGWFSSDPTMQAGLLAWLTSGLTTVLLVWFLRTQLNEKVVLFALSAMVGGAIGNLYDRIQLGYVVDFVQLYVGSWSFPVFNLADSLICVGAFFIMLGTVKKGTL